VGAVQIAELTGAGWRFRGSAGKRGTAGQCRFGRAGPSGRWRIRRSRSWSRYRGRSGSRRRRTFPGALSNTLRPQFATWLGWFTDPDAGWIIIRNPGQDLADVLWQALKIGHPAPLGETSTDTWDGPLRALPLLTADQITGRNVLDVRQDSEYTTGHLPGALNWQLGDLPAHHEQGTEPVLVMCGHGERAATAASLLLRTGHPDVTVLDGGPWDWAKATGEPLEEGR
jgi:hydroxyacylglutathione hydrolase